MGDTGSPRLKYATVDRPGSSTRDAYKRLRLLCGLLLIDKHLVQFRDVGPDGGDVHRVADERCCVSRYSRRKLSTLVSSSAALRASAARAACRLELGCRSALADALAARRTPP